MVTLNPVSRSVAALLIDLKSTKHITEFPPDVTIYPGVQTEDILKIINNVAIAQENDEKDRVISLLNNIDKNLAQKYEKLNGINSTKVTSTEVSTGNQKKTKEETKKNTKNTKKMKKHLLKKSKRIIENDRKINISLSSANQQLKTEKEKLLKKNNILEISNQELEKEFHETEKTIKELRKTTKEVIQELEMENKNLNQELNKVKENNISLVLFKTQLEKKNKELIERDKKRDKELREELKKNFSLTKKAVELEECEKKLSLLKEKYEKTIPLSRENLSLKNKYEKLKILNKVLKMELDVDENPKKQKNPEEFNNLHRQIKINNEILRQKKIKKK